MARVGPKPALPRQGDQVMIRFWTAATLALATAALAGCGDSGGPGVYAAAPTGKPGMTYTVSSGGRYTLYHASRTKDDKPDPSSTERVAGFDMRPGETL